MTHTNTEAVSDAKLKEMLEGLEGVTPGPWAVYDGCSWRRIGTVNGRYDDCAVLYPVVASDGHPDLSSRAGDREANLAHIARCDPDTIRYLVTRELSRRAPNSAGGVEVKALEWQAIGPVGSDIVAQTIIGEYTINRDNPSAGGAYNLWLAGADDNTFSDHATLVEAKTAAQADFNRRILSALTHPSSPVSAEVTEKMAMACDEWPSWLSEAVERTNEFADSADASTEQAVAFGILSILGGGK